jgi:hypothetical protein
MAVAGGLSIVAVAGVLGGFAATRSAQSSAITLVANGTVVTTRAQANDAIAKAEKQVGFAVKEPKSFPTRANELERVDTHGPTGPNGIPARTSLLLTYGTGDPPTGDDQLPTGLQVEKIVGPAVYHDGSPLDVDLPGGFRAWKMGGKSGAAGVFYGFTSAEFTIELLFQGELPTDEEAMQLFTEVR